MGNLLTIAIADPLNIFTIDDIAAITKHKITVVIGSSKDIDEVYAEYYEAGTHEAIEKIIDAGNSVGESIKNIEAVLNRL